MANSNQEIDNNHNFLRNSYSIADTAIRLDESHHTEQQYNLPENIWSNFVEGTEFPNGTDMLFDSEHIIDLQPNPSTSDNDNVTPQVDQQEDSLNTPLES
ncbi:102_t:CDS:1 [Ambispora leptoticha]|uniref:102_t:CDS:1 n=1 Tax=Ambispora leptoticha TaxID=144679 RepID=A0A9N9BUZ6_9GLOM|nr:102_t:CDS:1 [Ambispora leptoticha]